jgi:hypothetical protein
MLCNAYDDMASFSYYNTRGVTPHGRLMMLGLSSLWVELRHALQHCPTSYGRWDIGPYGANLADEMPQHLVRTDLGH